MDTKYNEATYNRPEGDRILDAPFVFIDIEKYSDQLREEDAWTKNDRNSITIYKTTGLTMVLSWLKSGATFTDNTSAYHITVQVLQGQVEIVVETGTIQLKKQQIVALHPNILNTLKASEDSLLLISSKVAG